MSQETSVPLQLQALLNRLQARLGSGVVDAAASLLAAAEGAPERFSREWTLFWQEVELEAERLAQQGGANPANAPDAPVGVVSSTDRSDPQALIDSLRARVAALSHRLDA
ncbi:MAG: hypothetical protein FJ050_01050 [Cyanobacteria bacterium M_surface_7_m2_040]|nr:hypothetical protein [Cyanobacteria bacterium M_surface_7_m2_040]